MKNLHTPFILYTVFILGALAMTPAHAADGTWITTSGTNNWTTSTNWDGGIVPGEIVATKNSTATNTDIAIFNQSPTGGTAMALSSMNTNTGYINVGGVKFDHNSVNNRYTVENGVLLTSGGVIESTASGSHTDVMGGWLIIAGDGGSGTAVNNGSGASLLINAVQGVSTTGNATTFYLDGTSTARNFLSATISDGSFGGKLNLVKNGASTWRISHANNNPYTGTTTLNAGVLEYGRSNSFGSGTLILNGGDLRNYTSRDANEFLPNDVILNGTVAFSYSSTNLNDTGISGNVDLNGGTRTINTTTAERNFILSGVISNGGLTKGGNGTLTLAGANTYVGDTTVNAGTLVLAQGGGLTFDIGANGVNNQITGTSTVFLDGEFTFDLSGADSTPGNSWLIVDVDNLTETFGTNFFVHSFTDGGSGNWTLADGYKTWTFQESTGVLNVVPEPATALLTATGLIFLLHRRRRRD